MGTHFRNRSVWTLCIFAGLSASVLRAQDYQAQQARAVKAHESFFEPMNRGISWGEWRVSAAIDPDYDTGKMLLVAKGGVRRDHHFSFLYRGEILATEQQMEALAKVHAGSSPAELASRLIFAELEIQGGSGHLPGEGKSFIKALKGTQGSVLQEEMNLLPMHPTYYLVRTDTTPDKGREYRVDGWRGGIEDMEQALKKGVKLEPLQVLLKRMEAQYLHRWKEEMRRVGYTPLLNRMDMKAQGYALFDWACGEGEVALANRLLDLGVDAKNAGVDGRWPLISACRSHDRPLVRRLLDAGAPLESKDSNEISPLAAAAREGDAALVRELLSLGAICRIPEPFSFEDPIHLAAQSDLETLRVLLDAAGPVPASFKLPDERGDALLDYACWNDHADIADWLLREGFKPGAGTLVHASSEGSLKVMALLLKSGMDPNTAVESSFGRTPLIEAIQRGQTEAVILLIGGGAKVDQPDREMTPLCAAVGSGEAAMVKLLLAKGANPNLHQPRENADFDSPLALARALDHDEIVEILLKAGAK